MPITKEIEIRFRDCDMLQHVNNAVYLSYLEEARAAYNRHVRSDDAAADFQYLIGTVTIRYLSPALYGETLAIEAAVSDMRRSSFTMSYRITSKADDRLIAEAETIQVMYDFDKQASMPIPDDLRARIGAFEGRDF